MLRRNFNSFRQRLSGFVRPDSEGERVNPQMFFEVTGKCGGVHLREILLGVYSHFLLSTIFFSFSERSASLTNTTSPLRRVTSRAASELRARRGSPAGTRVVGKYGQIPCGEPDEGVGRVGKGYDHLPDLSRPDRVPRRRVDEFA